MPRPARSHRLFPVTDEGIVAEYVLRHRPFLLDQMDWFGDTAQTFPAAIRRAAAALNRKGNRLSHQYRLSGGVLAEAASRLLSQRKKLQSAENFEELHGIVESTIRPIYGVGPLYVYDTALRLGAYLGLEPDRVHLHAGARMGARAMLGLGPSRGPSIELSALREAYRGLSAFEAENLLCCYHKAFASQ